MSCDGGDILVGTATVGCCGVARGGLNTTMKLLLVVALIWREGLCGAPSVQIGKICICEITPTIPIFTPPVHRPVLITLTVPRFSPTAPRIFLPLMRASLISALITRGLRTVWRLLLLLLQCSNNVNIFIFVCA